MGIRLIIGRVLGASIRLKWAITMHEAPLPISLVAQWVFCPRRAWLEAAGEHVDDYTIQVGFESHTRINNRAASRGNELRSVQTVINDGRISVGGLHPLRGACA